MGKVYLVLLIPTIIESGSRRVFILKIILVLYKNPLTNRLIRRICLSDIKKISLITRFIRMPLLIIYLS
jgi:hypothetical protein